MSNNYLDRIGLNALNASKDLVLLNEKKKNKVLTDFYKNLKSNKKKILTANKIDVLKATSEIKLLLTKSWSLMDGSGLKTLLGFCQADAYN